tara:strand:- start:1213 stop:1587 length:375 start_codon:yes stop_codon:yes gene_type:complete
MDESLGTLALGLLILTWLYYIDPRADDTKKLDQTTKFYLRIAGFGFIAWFAYKTYSAHQTGENNFGLFKTPTTNNNAGTGISTPEAKYGTVRVSDDARAPHVLEQPFWNSGTTNEVGNEIAAAT